MFPNEPRNPGAVEALASRVTEADFSLSGGELTLHYVAGDIYRDKANILHVRFYYPQFAGMWTEKGERATDNARWKMIALTFDDGPSYMDRKDGGSRWILPEFRAAGWRVTFYIWGKNIISCPDVLMVEADNNHSLQNHSRTHPYGSEVTSERFAAKQISDVDDWMADTIGVRTTSFRAPFGMEDPWLKYGIDKPLIGWSIDPKDPNKTSVNSLINALKKAGLYDGGIVLLHDTRKNTTMAIPAIAELLREEGYMTVTVDELAAIRGIVLEPGVLYHQLAPVGNPEEN